MSERFLTYLRGEQSRLEDLIDREMAKPASDRLLVARLEKLRRAVSDQIAEIEQISSGRKAA